MARSSSPFALLLGLSTSLPLLAYLYLRLNPELDRTLQAATGHFYIVSSAALLAGGVAVIIGVAGTRVRNIQVTFVTMAFISLALVFSLHGLATPGFILSRTAIPGVAAQLSVMLTAFWLWMSSRPSDHPWVRYLSDRQSWLVPLWVMLLVIGSVILFFNPGLIIFIPLNQSPLSWTAMAVTLLLNLFTFLPYWRSYLYSHFPLQAALLFSLGWLTGAQLIISTGELWKWSWWLYHYLFLAATIVMLVGLVRQYSMGSSIATAIRGLFTTDPHERIEAGISPSVRALVIATETRDPYTAGHSYRVAIFAMRIAETLSLPPLKLRALAQGAIVHDVGKIEVPDQVLNKPGRLDSDERKVIERHPVTGYHVCRRLGFLQEELDVIRHHHERWDGTGYPDGLKGTAIPILARILAVADVYDALTSTRAYRQAWSHEQAMALLKEESGKAFDPACVEAWARAGGSGMENLHLPLWNGPGAAAGAAGRP